MIAIRALDGVEVIVNENAVTLVAGPYPHDVGPHTYVHGVDRGVLVTRHDDPNARNAKRGSQNPDIEIRGPNSLPLSNDSLYVEAPRQAMLSRKTEAVVTRLRTCLAA